MATYRTGTLDLEADHIGRACGWRQVDVRAGHVGRAGVGQWQKVDGLQARRLWQGRSHLECLPTASGSGWPAVKGGGGMDGRMERRTEDQLRDWRTGGLADWGD